MELPKTLDMSDFEDPARCWIDLVTAFKSGDPARVREVMEQAKTSKWSHDLLDDLEQEAAAGNAGDTMVESEGCVHAQCRGAGYCMIDDDAEEGSSH